MTSYWITSSGGWVLVDNQLGSIERTYYHQKINHIPQKQMDWRQYLLTKKVGGPPPFRTSVSILLSIRCFLWMYEPLWRSVGWFYCRKKHRRKLLPGSSLSKSSMTVRWYGTWRQQAKSLPTPEEMGETQGNGKCITHAGPMYSIFTYISNICHKNQSNAGKYTIHGIIFDR